MAKSRKNFLGSWAFLVGVVLAVVLGLVGTIDGTWTIVLVVIGLIVGLLNVTAKETMPFLMSGTVLIIVSALGGGFLAEVQILADMVNALLVVFVPATIIVAIKNVFNLSRN